jgi:hypothetical protein
MVSGLKLQKPIAPPVTPLRRLHAAMTEGSLGFVVRPTRLGTVGTAAGFLHSLGACSWASSAGRSNQTEPDRSQPALILIEPGVGYRSHDATTGCHVAVLIE